MSRSRKRVHERSYRKRTIEETKTPKFKEAIRRWDEEHTFVYEEDNPVEQISAEDLSTVINAKA